MISQSLKRFGWTPVLLLLLGSFTAFADDATEPVVDSEPVLSEALEQVDESVTPAVDDVSASKSSVYVVPIQGAIGSPTLFILRRALKEAIENGVNTVVIDMNTPGGELGTTLKIMEALDRFEGNTITYVNNEAISAGAFISVITDKIYFRSDGMIGAAEVVAGGGQDIPEGMKRKLQSYINAKVRVYTESHRYRGDVMRAMTDPTFELIIEEEVLSPKEELLSLTARESIREFGDPPERLLGEAIVESIEELLVMEYGEGGFEIRSFEITWSEELAQWLQKIVPVLMGLGMLLLLIEFKTPSFGIIGGIGIALILIVFASNYVAGLAGHEMILLFVLGVILIGVEVFVLPGTLVFGFLGIAVMLFSLVWSLSDIWPADGGGVDFALSWPSLVRATQTVILSTLGALVAIVVIWRVLPSRVFESRLVHVGQSPNPSAVSLGGAFYAKDEASLPDIGSNGVVKTNLRPSGSVEIDGESYAATVAVGFLVKGTPIKVVAYRNYALLVEKVEEHS